VTVFLEESSRFSVVDVDGSLRAPVSGELRRKTAALLAGGERRIVLDLARVTDIDAAGIGELVRVYNDTTVAGGLLYVKRPTLRVRRLLAIAGVLWLLRVPER